MTILAFMQNQWFNNPDKVRADLARYSADPERQLKLRRRMIHYALFAGCKSGRVLTKVFGDLCDDIIWEEASTEIGGHAASSFPADLPHMRKTIQTVEPRIVIGFGRTACDALRVIDAELDIAPMEVFYAPHPAARHATAMEELRIIAAAVKATLQPKEIEIE